MKGFYKLIIKRQNNSVVVVPTKQENKTPTKFPFDSPVKQHALQQCESFLCFVLFCFILSKHDYSILINLGEVDRDCKTRVILTRRSRKNCQTRNQHLLMFN